MPRGIIFAFNRAFLFRSSAFVPRHVTARLSQRSLLLDGTFHFRRCSRKKFKLKPRRDRIYKTVSAKPPHRSLCLRDKFSREASEVYQSVPATGISWLLSLLDIEKRPCKHARRRENYYRANILSETISLRTKEDERERDGSILKHGVSRRRERYLVH